MAAKKKSRRRLTIGADPLDTLVPAKAATKASRRGLTPAGAVAARARPAEPPKREKVRATFHLPEDLVNECRDAVVTLSGPPLRLTMAALAENGLRRELQRLKKAHNKGKAFPKWGSRLKGGRPIGS